jgi:RNA polymerase sigma-70 factor, ECF subfamily
MSDVWVGSDTSPARNEIVVDLRERAAPPADLDRVKERLPTTASRLCDPVTIEALRSGDGVVFAQLVRSCQGSMLRLAETFVHTPATAEDVVQETWIAVLRGLDRFEGRSTLRTWIFQILINRAKSRGLQEQRHAHVALDRAMLDPRGSGCFAEPLSAWTEPLDVILADETARTIRAAIREAIGLLPPRQAQVLILRDLDGLPSSEASQLLGVSDANQRVLLHRARIRLRQLLDSQQHVAATKAAGSVSADTWVTRGQDAARSERLAV